MKDFFTYITAGEEDKQWGLYLNVVGRARIVPQTQYPSLDHPTGYYFHWDTGRILQEFQLIYITEGQGVFENEAGRFQLKPGSLMIIRPGIRHRYRPLKKTGWVENYIGFNGDLAHGLLNQSIFTSSHPVVHIGFREELLDTYYKIFDWVHKEEPGFQQISSGLIIKLLGHLIAFQKKRDFSGKHIEAVIQKIRFYMRENVQGKIDLKHLADENNVAYSYLRKMFKKYTGISPHQYYLELKIIRAREMLLTSEKSIKEIAYDLNFDSIHYFSRLFKKKTGVNPSDLRDTSLRKTKEKTEDGYLFLGK